MSATALAPAAATVTALAHDIARELVQKASRTVASPIDTATLTSFLASSISASVSASASSIPTNINSGDGALFALFVIPVVFAAALWMIVSVPVIIFHSSQAFFNFLAMCCFASVAAFQAKWDVGPSGLSGFALFASIFCFFLALLLVLVPWTDGKYGKLTRFARVLTETRVAFILSATGFGLDLLLAFISTISAWTEAGCKNPDNDPNADKGDDFKNGLSGWCSTKKAGAIFFWIGFASWIGTVVIIVMNWRNGKARGPRDPPFRPPMDAEGGAGAYGELDEEEEEEEREHQYGRVPSLNLNEPSHTNASPFADSNAANRNSTSSYVLPPVSGVGGFSSNMPASRPSMDAYGAFSDPAPTGYGQSAQASFSDAAGLGGGGQSPSGVSRTMQYADPYAAVRASIAGTPPAAPANNPPGYSEYSGYR